MYTINLNPANLLQEEKMKHNHVYYRYFKGLKYVGPNTAIWGWVRRCFTYKIKVT